MFNYDAVHMRYEPYPLAVLRPALDEKLYTELAASFPSAGIFGKIPKYDYKLSLSEKFNSSEYEKFIRSNATWRRFHSWLKSEDFIRQTIAFLVRQNVDLGLDEAFETTSRKLGRIANSLLSGRLPNRRLRLRTRFEFSILKADGGEVAPHTDTPKKIITLVLSMIRDGDWKPEFGGGLDVNRATDNAFAFNWKNRIVPWDKIETIATIPFVPNQCTVFVKTFNSLHSVRKMQQAGSDALRKTITIVIEKDD
jgi:hypothetical protein